MIDQLKSSLLRAWSQTLPYSPMPTKLHFLFSGYDSCRSKIVVVFADDQQQPSLVIKIARDTDAAEVLREEFNNLTFAHSKTRDSLPWATPTPVAYENFGQGHALVETALNGKTLESKWESYSRKKWLKAVEADIVPATELLVDCHKKLSTKASLVSVNDLSAKIWSTFNDVYEPTEGEISKHRKIATALRNLKDTSLPYVWTHGDFWSGNIVQSPNGSLGLIDWEFSTQKGLPFWDLFLFIVAIAVYSPWAQYGRDPAAGFRFIFSNSSPLKRTFHRAIDCYAKGISFQNHKLYGTLFDMFLFDLATRNYRQRTKKNEQDKDFRQFLSISRGINDF